MRRAARQLAAEHLVGGLWPADGGSRRDRIARSGPRRGGVGDGRGGGRNPVSPGRHPCGAAHRVVIVLSNPAATLAAVSGLSAAIYLVLRHAAGSGAGLDSVSGATLVGAVGFAFAGVVATAFPLQLPWLPLLAPLAVFAVYLLATRPFLRS